MPTNVFFNLNESKQDLIIQASIREFSNYSLNEVQVKRIVETANISRGSFYQYFENIEDLFRYIVLLNRDQIFHNAIVNSSIENEVDLIEFVRKQVKQRLISHLNNLDKNDIKIISQVKRDERAITIFIETLEFIPNILNDDTKLNLLKEVVFPTIKLTFIKYLKDEITGKIALKEIDNKLDLIKNGVV